jgi:hypothetical protein
MGFARKAAKRRLGFVELVVGQPRGGGPDASVTLEAWISRVWRSASASARVGKFLRTRLPSSQPERENDIPGGIREF